MGALTWTYCWLGHSGSGPETSKQLVAARFKLAGQTAKSQRNEQELEAMKLVEEMERRSAEEVREMNREAPAQYVSPDIIHKLTLMRIEGAEDAE